jgi:iron complex transport system substrate-binding protein
LREYNATLALAKSDTKTVLSGAMFQDQWYVPQGDKLGGSISKDAQADYLWRDTKVEVHPCLLRLF